MIWQLGVAYWALGISRWDVVRHLLPGSLARVLGEIKKRMSYSTITTEYVALNFMISRMLSRLSGRIQVNPGVHTLVGFTYLSRQHGLPEFAHAAPELPSCIDHS